ncbi:DUF5367 domain-containing protein [Microvirga terrae]|uniref:DUF5367 domain-containing protein n=1 Tax=Microvirga terrae TaxID=2740529 RepID=A0ABY5RQA5_9HYPH|nr:MULTISPECIES: DUF5367 family protein [Microvirga]MBQ0821947.1 DUF5367 family protein [Microvirga sp. HBU67558]UVF19440.1 DUF5367 domain-containing protein [Microvirga terrae]
MMVRSLGLGVGIAAAILALFWLAGPWFFQDGRRPFQLNFTAGAVLGSGLGLTIDRILQVPRKAASHAMALTAVPGMLVMAAVGSHFAVFFPQLDPALDKVFGSLMLWFYGFALTGALWVARRP